MNVSELIKQLEDCRGDADVFTDLFDNGNSLDLAKGLDNRGNYVVIFKQIAFDSPRNIPFWKQFGRKK